MRCARYGEMAALTRGGRRYVYLRGLWSSVAFMYGWRFCVIMLTAALAVGWRLTMVRSELSRGEANACEARSVVARIKHPRCQAGRRIGVCDVPKNSGVALSFSGVLVFNSVTGPNSRRLLLAALTGTALALWGRLRRVLFVCGWWDLGNLRCSEKPAAHSER